MRTHDQDLARDFVKMSDVKPKLKQLALELRDLTWSEVVQLAVQLEIKYQTLRQIEERYSDVKARVIAAMDCWLELDPTASWKNIVKALKAIEKNVLAEKIKYCYLPQAHASHQTSLGEEREEEIEEKEGKEQEEGKKEEEYEEEEEEEEYEEEEEEGEEEEEEEEEDDISDYADSASSSSVEIPAVKRYSMCVV